MVLADPEPVGLGLGLGVVGSEVTGTLGGGGEAGLAGGLDDRLSGDVVFSCRKIKPQMEKKTKNRRRHKHISTYG